MTVSSLNLGNDFGLQIKIQLVLWYQIFQHTQKNGHIGKVNTASQKRGMELLKLVSLCGWGVPPESVEEA